MQQHQHIFIGGLHRRGPSLLFRALRDHPQTSGFKDTGEDDAPAEGQFLQSVYPIARTYGRPGRFGPCRPLKRALTLSHRRQCAKDLS